MSDSVACMSKADSDSMYFYQDIRKYYCAEFLNATVLDTRSDWNWKHWNIIPW